MSVLNLSGTERDEVVNAKDRAQAIFLGRIVNLDPEHGFLARHEVWHPFLSDASGDMWVQSIPRVQDAAIFGREQLEQLLRYSDSHSR